MAPNKRKKRTNSVKRNLNYILDLPQELILDVEKIVIIGKEQVYIENHSGIDEYEDFRVRIKTNDGVISIEGLDLRIDKITSEDILVEGDIKIIEFR